MIRKYLILGLLVVLLAACSEKMTEMTFSEAQTEIKEINQALLSGSKSSEEKDLPFSEAYLKKRHLTLKALNIDSLTPEQQSELQFLIIQERYPERYLPWPAMINVAQQLESSQKLEWQQLVISRLNEAQESKIFYNRYEVAKLIEYSKLENLTELSVYLKNYKPRSRLGLQQLPNGKEWYQSKINHYYSAVEKPQELLGLIQKSTLEQENNGIDVSDFDLLKVAKQHCTVQSGLNWIDGYINLPATFNNCDMAALNTYRQLILVSAEVDLGIHYQAWSEQQALVVLMKKLKIDNTEAKVLLQDIVFKPAAVLALAKEFLKD